MTRGQLLIAAVFLMTGPVASFGGGEMREATHSADHLFVHGDFRTAYEQYAAALQTAPDDVNIVERLGFLHFFQGRYEQGLASFQKVMRTDPARKALMHAYMAFSYYLMQQYADVLRILEEAGHVSDNLNTEQLRYLANNTPYQIVSHHEHTVIPLLRVDPLPVIEITVNSQNIFVFIDTGAV